MSTVEGLRMFADVLVRAVTEDCIPPSETYELDVLELALRAQVDALNRRAAELGQNDRTVVLSARVGDRRDRLRESLDDQGDSLEGFRRFVSELTPGSFQLVKRCADEAGDGADVEVGSVAEGQGSIGANRVRTSHEETSSQVAGQVRDTPAASAMTLGEAADSETPGAVGGACAGECSSHGTPRTPTHPAASSPGRARTSRTSTSSAGNPGEHHD